MNQPSAIDVMVAALQDLPPYENPLIPVYTALGQAQGPLTLQVIRQHAQLLHDHADQARDQTYAVNQVIRSCTQIPPTPLPLLPHGF